MRSVLLHRGVDRPLRTLIFFPAGAAVRTKRPVVATLPGTPATRSGTGMVKFGTAAAYAIAVVRQRTFSVDSVKLGSAVRNAAPAAGRFPLVLFSHGLHGIPEGYSDALASWASAGFVVAAPEYPFTSRDAVDFKRRDIKRQPADAAVVLAALRGFDRLPGGPLEGHIDVDRVAAIGHSAGAYTTTGLFRAGHPRWLRSGVVMAGWLAPGAFAGPPATILFVQGAHDTVVPLGLARAAYNAVPWTKSALLLPGSWHADYMLATGKAYALMNQTVTDFLRWTLERDQAARRHLPPTVPARANP